jgi:hypothetical protein
VVLAFVLHRCGAKSATWRIFGHVVVAGFVAPPWSQCFKW